MSRKSTDYTKTIIYKICCKDDSITDIYIGRTLDLDHRCCFESNKEYNLKHHKFIRENGGVKNWRHEIIESYNCDSKKEAENRTKYWIELLKPSLNLIKKVITDEEKKQRAKQWREENKDKIKEKDRLYYENNKDKIKEGKKENKDKIKEYEQKRKEDKIECKCGSIILKKSFIKHSKNCNICKEKMI